MDAEETSVRLHQVKEQNRQKMRDVIVSQGGACATERRMPAKLYGQLHSMSLMDHIGGGGGGSDK